MNVLTRLFTPDHVRYEGVRPINIHLLRVLYFMMAAFVGTGAWRTVITHEGPWDPVRAVAWCAWVAYPTLSVLGLIHPLRMLPILLFMIFYKAVWLGAVAYPMWQAGTLAGSLTGAMARDFSWLWMPIIAVPWGYVLRTFVLPARRGTAGDAGSSVISGRGGSTGTAHRPASG
jgi:hypothetical protein